jgi:hypothetical protein
MDRLDEYVSKAAALDAFLSPKVPEAMSLIVVGWKKEDLHNRYMVTDRCGVTIGEGIGLPDALSSRRDDVLAVLDAATTEKLMKQFSENSKHQLSHRVRGTRPLPA